MIPPLLEEIFSTRTVYDKNGNVYPLHSETPIDQIEFLISLLKQIEARRCLEIGLAYGISTLATCDAISGFGDRVMYSIDPDQIKWRDIGLKNIDDAGFSPFVRFFREPSAKVLSRLQDEAVVLDFVYIDSTKIFDILHTDVFYCTNLLRKGGLLVLDDCGIPGPHKLARYLLKMPHWRIYASHGAGTLNWKRRLAASAAKLMPGGIRTKLLSPALSDPETERRINGRCIAFQKLSEDERRWDWFADF
jgi:predicted O-methyltransferase YrrM